MCTSRDMEKQQTRSLHVDAACGNHLGDKWTLLVSFRGHGFLWFSDIYIGHYTFLSVYLNTVDSRHKIIALVETKVSKLLIFLLHNGYVYMQTNNPLLIGLTTQSDWKAL